MLADRQTVNYHWNIVRFNAPVMWQRTEDETWILNPRRRYVLNSAHLAKLTEHIESISDLDGSGLYRPLRAGVNLSNSTVLVERMRDRGIGDLLFLTGPLNFFHHVTGSSVNIDIYSLADRGSVLSGCPWLSSKSALAGPLHYDDFQHYDHHWIIGTVTECNEEPDQLNVYDALYRQLGFDPAQIDCQFKRPTAWLMPEDEKNLDQFFYMVWMQKKVDLRRSGFYVVAPLAASSLRCMNYADWLPIIKELADRRPVVVLGLLHERMPFMGMSVGQFNVELGQVSEGVVNMLGNTNLRFTMALIAKANCVVTLDTGPLYIAEAFRRPAISLWGTHHPGVRLGYDKDYMDLAIWEQAGCDHSPCYAYGAFPAHKCPLGVSQAACQVLSSVTVEAVTAKLDQVESQGAALGSFKSAT